MFINERVNVPKNGIDRWKAVSMATDGFACSAEIQKSNRGIPTANLDANRVSTLAIDTVDCRRLAHAAGALTCLKQQTFTIQLVNYAYDCLWRQGSYASEFSFRRAVHTSHG